MFLIGSFDLSVQFDLKCSFAGLFSQWPLNGQTWGIDAAQNSNRCELWLVMQRLLSCYVEEQRIVRISQEQQYVSIEKVDLLSPVPLMHLKCVHCLKFLANYSKSIWICIYSMYDGNLWVSVCIFRHTQDVLIYIHTTPCRQCHAFCLIFRW